MRLPLYQVDAFTTRRFRGNPAAVVPLDAWLDDRLLLDIAAENNLSETAFVVPDHDPATFHLRWFTPTVEVDLCGHATLAAGYALRHHRGVAAARITFLTRSGPLHVEFEDDQVVLDLPVIPCAPIDRRADVDHALGATTVELLATDARRLIAVLDDESTVAGLRPDIAAIAAIERGSLVVTAPGDTVDFVSRFFAPGCGVPEDPVTGSNHCTLTPLWAARLGRDDLVARQVSARGGELRCRLRDDRVRIGGGAVTTLTGELWI